MIFLNLLYVFQDYSYWTRSVPMQHLTIHIALDQQVDIVAVNPIVYRVYNIVNSIYSTYSSHHNGVEVAPEPEMERNGIVRMEILFCVFWKNQSFESANNTRAAI